MGLDFNIKDILDYVVVPLIMYLIMIDRKVHLHDSQLKSLIKTDDVLFEKFSNIENILSNIAKDIHYLMKVDEKNNKD